MSDVMLLGVLRMPMPDNPDPLTLRQFVSRAQQAACRIEADTDELEELRGKCEVLENDAERYRKIRRGQHWSVIDGVGETLLGASLDAAVDAVPAVGAA